MGILTLLIALAISGVAAWYSIVGLMAIFSSAAVAIAKKHAEGHNVVNEVLKIDYEIEKNYNDAVFFQHSYKQSDDELRKEVLECRLDIATTKIDKGRTRLEDYIYN